MWTASAAYPCAFGVRGAGLPFVGFGCRAGPPAASGRGHMTTIRQLSRPGMSRGRQPDRRGALARWRLERRRASRRSRNRVLSATPSRQADQGRTAYGEHCASCHGEVWTTAPMRRRSRAATSGRNGARNPRRRCSRTPSTKMPPARPGSLGDESYAQLLAYMLQENGSTAGHARAAGRSRGAESDGVARLAARRRRRAGAGA